MNSKLLRLSAILALGTILAFVTPNAYSQARVFGNASATATATAGAATSNGQSGIVTSETPLTTAAGADYTLTLTNSQIRSAAAIVYASVANGANTGGSPSIGRITPGTGNVVIIVHNSGATAFTGTIKVTFCVMAGG